MKQQSIIITLGIIQVILLTLFGLYFYRLAHRASSETPAVRNSPAQERETGAPASVNGFSRGVSVEI